MNLDLRRRQVATILSDWKQEVDLRAAGALCPMSGCGALVISYEPADSLNEARRDGPARQEFVCSECGTEFTASRPDLLFQSVPREWLFSRVCEA